MKKLNVMRLYFLLVCDPPLKQHFDYGKGCPDGEESKCLNKNKEYNNIKWAWEECNEVLDCAFIMRFKEGKYFHRRESDPNMTGPGIWGYRFDCPSK